MARRHFCQNCGKQITASTNHFVPAEIRNAAFELYCAACKDLVNTPLSRRHVCPECGNGYVSRKNEQPDPLCPACMELSFSRPYWRDEFTETDLKEIESILTVRNLRGADIRRALIESHGARCWICGTIDPPFHVDHDHNSGLVRGLLCAGCNYGLGWFRDDPIRMQQAIKYLANNYSNTVHVEYMDVRVKQSGKLSKRGI